jgi:hypothetical protein
MIGFTVILPCEYNRFDLLANTIERYKEFGIHGDVEFLIPSRTLEEKQVGPVRIIPYSWDGEFFSTSLPLNTALRQAKYQNIVVASPEVMPKTDVFKQLRNLPRGNYICQVFDEDVDGDASFSLVNTNFRFDTPAMYFLACFKKEDIELINGWDEDFMGTYAFEDNDFGNRFVRAGLSFEVRDEIQGVHQYHPRGFPNQDAGLNAARLLLKHNDDLGITRPKNGLVKE